MKLPTAVNRPLLAACALGLVIPLVLPDAYMVRVGILVLVYFALSLGYSLLVNNAGLFHFGFIMYFALAAYMEALLTVRLGFPFWFSFIVSIVGTVLVGVVTGVVSVGARGDYLALVTLGFGEILHVIANAWMSVMRGPFGIPGIPPIALPGLTLVTTTANYYFVLALVAASVFLTIRLARSPVGLYWAAIRDDEDVLISLGVHSAKWKVVAFGSAALLSAPVGAFFAHFQRIVTPDVTLLDNTVVLITMVVLGGTSLFGLLVAATVLTVVPEILRPLAILRPMFLGFLFVLLANVRPSGIAGGSDVFYRLPAAPNRRTRRDGTARLFDFRRSDTDRVGPTTRSILVTEGLSKRFRGLVALDGVSLSVEAGQIVAVIGPNGAGKTTLFNIVSGMVRATGGRVWLEGRDISKYPAHRIGRLGMARTFQNIRLFESLTCLDNVMVGLLSSRSPRLKDMFWTPKERRWADSTGVAIAADLLDIVGLTNKADEYGRNLPYGDRRRLEIARALATMPRILLVDEPSAGMSPEETDGIRQLLSRLNGEGLTILMIEHNMKLAMRLAHEVVVLDYGKKIAAGAPADIQSNSEVIEAYLGRVKTHVSNH